MKSKIACHVCDRPAVEDDICPNCETDLSVIRLLMDLPAVESVPLSKTIARWQLSLVVLLISLGIGVGFAGNAIVSQPAHLEAKELAAAIARVEFAPQPTAQIKSCGGFNYTVRRGDELSELAWRFYGESELWQKIVKANSTIQERPDNLQIGEVILIPNREEACL